MENIIMLKKYYKKLKQLCDNEKRMKQIKRPRPKIRGKKKKEGFRDSTVSSSMMMSPIPFSEFPFHV
jgi:hypothetical protein